MDGVGASHEPKVRFLFGQLIIEPSDVVSFTDNAVPIAVPCNPKGHLACREIVL